MTAAPAVPVFIQAPTAASGKTAPLKISLAARVSTLGVGIEGSLLVAPVLALRVGYNGYSYSRTQTSQDVTYDGKLKLSNVTALADLYPSKSGSFHLTGGLVFNSNTITAHGKPSGSGSTQTYTLNGTTYSAADVGSLDGRATFSKTAPYLGIGFGKPAGSSPVQFLFDVGVVFQGKPHLSLTRSGGLTVTDPVAQQPDQRCNQRPARQDPVRPQQVPVLPGCVGGPRVLLLGASKRSPVQMHNQ